MNSYRQWSFRVLAVALLLGASQPALAVNVFTRDEVSLNVGVLLHPQLQLTANGAPNGSYPGTDVYLRRLRLLVYGNATQRISFFLMTDSPNFGKGGNYDTSLYVQDAFVSFQLIDGLWVDGGLLLLPFSRHGMQGATALNSVDYHSGVIRYPTGSQKVWRDGGVQLRGAFLDKRLTFRAGAFRGSRPGTDARTPELPPLNPEGAPRLAGTVRYALLGTDDGLFLSGLYFAERPVVSVGVSAVYQSKSVYGPHGVTDHLGLSADVFAEVPIAADQELIFQGAYYHYRQGTGSAETGHGLLTELGYRYQWLEPVVGYDWFNGDARTADLRAFKAGLNFWIQKHTFNVKAEYSRTLSGDVRKPDARAVQAVNVLAHLFF